MLSTCFALEYTLDFYEVRSCKKLFTEFLMHQVQIKGGELR